MIRLLFVALLVVAPSLADADNPSLAGARKAVDDIRYDDARRLLVEALRQGASSPEELVEIYRLSAATAAVLGEPELAEQYYRRMLALDPAAMLPPDASPRLREPFVAAQAYMAAQQRFTARARRTGAGAEVSIVDPLGMVVAVATLARGEVWARAAFAGAPVVLADAEHDIVLLDEHGNFLRVIAPPPVPVVETPPTPRTPLLRRPITWAIPATIFAGAGIAFFVDARLAKGRLDDILANDSMHFLEEAETERRRWRRHTIFAGAGVGLGAVFATTAIVLAVRHPTAVRVTPAVGADQASVLITAKF